MKVIPIFWLRIPDEVYSSPLTEDTWWSLFQSFVCGYLMKVILILRQKIRITFIRYPRQKIGISFIRYPQSKDWNKPIFWLRIPDEGYSNLLTEDTWWSLFQSLVWGYLIKFIPIFWLRIPDEGYSNLLTEDTIFVLLPWLKFNFSKNIYHKKCVPPPPHPTPLRSNFPQLTLILRWFEHKLFV
jgi:hypothetical protein